MCKSVYSYPFILILLSTFVCNAVQYNMGLVGSKLECIKMRVGWSLYSTHPCCCISVVDLYTDRAVSTR